MSTAPTPTITQIAFDDDIDLITAQPIIFDNQYTRFEINNKTKVPGANTVAFNTDYGWKSIPPTISSGVGVGEYVIISIDAVTISEIEEAIEGNNFRIAMHVQAIGEANQSAALISTFRILPEPSSLMLLGIGGVVCLLRRKRV